MTATYITLPWPEKTLSPNARVHYHEKGKARRRAKNYAYCQALEAERFTPATGEELTLTIRVYPPDRRKRDIDNVFASLKAAIDGIAEAFDFDDVQIKRTILERCNVKKDGLIVLKIEGFNHLPTDQADMVY